MVDLQLSICNNRGGSSSCSRRLTIWKSAVSLSVQSSGKSKIVDLFATTVQWEVHAVSCRKCEGMREMTSSWFNLRGEQNTGSWSVSYNHSSIVRRHASVAIATSGVTFDFLLSLRVSAVFFLIFSTYQQAVYCYISDYCPIVYISCSGANIASGRAFVMCVSTWGIAVGHEVRRPDFALEDKKERPVPSYNRHWGCGQAVTPTLTIGQLFGSRDSGGCCKRSVLNISVESQLTKDAMQLWPATDSERDNLWTWIVGRWQSLFASCPS